MKMKTDKDEQILRKHLLDLATREKGTLYFLIFNLNEQNIFFSMKQELPTSLILLMEVMRIQKERCCVCDFFNYRL